MALPMNEFETVAFVAYRSLTERVMQLRAAGESGVDMELALFMHRLTVDYIEDRIKVVPEEHRPLTPTPKEC